MAENKQVQEAFDEFDSFVLHLPEDMEAKDVHGEVSAFIQLTREKLGDVLHEQFLEAVVNPRFDTHFVAKNEAVTRLAEMRQEESARKLNEANQTISGQGAEINRHNAEAAETKRKADEALNQKVDTTAYAHMDIPEGVEDARFVQEWEKARTYRSLLGSETKYTFAGYLSALTPYVGFNLYQKPYQFGEGVTPLINAYFKVKYLSELPESEGARLPQTTWVQGFLKEIYANILQKIQGHLTHETPLSAEDVRYLQEIGLDLSDINLAEETLADRMANIRQKLKTTGTYSSNAVNKANIDHMVEHAYKHLFENDKQKADERKSSVGNWVNPFATAEWKRPATYPKGLLWDWTTKPVLNFSGDMAKKSKDWMSQNKAETIGGLIGTAIFPGVGTVLGAGAVRVFKKIAGK